jgi:hypothetical protein
LWASVHVVHRPYYDDVILLLVTTDRVRDRDNRGKSAAPEVE